MVQRPESGAGELRARKQALRRQILSQRTALEPAERGRLSDSITATLLTLPELARAHCVLAYLSFGSEFDTGAFVHALQLRGSTLVLPRIDRARRALTLHRVQDPQGDTLPGVWGIREPDPQRCPLAVATDIQAALVPGVAFTARGERLGYGGGYYDRMIGEQALGIPLVAAAFELQLVADLPLGPDDAPVDVVVTEARVYRRESI